MAGRRLQILCDCDGILSDFMSAALAIVRDIRRVSEDHPAYQAGRVTTFYLADHFRMESRERRLFHQRVEERGWCLGLRALPEAVDEIRRLREQHDVRIVTSPWDSSDHWIPERREWLRERFGDIPTVFTHRKYTIPGDVLLDDRPKHVSTWISSQKGLGLLWDFPHNRGSRLSKRVHSWADVRREIGILAGKEA